MLSIRKVRLLITSRYIAMQSYECVIISKMFLMYFISYGCNGGALVFLRGAEASASPSFALPMFITIKKIIILHLVLGVPAATVGGTGTPWHTRGYAPGTNLWALLLASGRGVCIKCLVFSLRTRVIRSVQSGSPETGPGVVQSRRHTHAPSGPEPHH